MGAAATELERRKAIVEAGIRITALEKSFCDQYLKCLDPVKAFRLSGYVTTKAKTDSARDSLDRQKAEALMAKEPCIKYIELMKEDMAARIGISLDDIFEEYKSMAFANMDDYVEWTKTGVKVKDHTTLTRAQKAGILEITQTKGRNGTTVKIKLYNKQTALDRLFDMLLELQDKKTKEKPLVMSQQQMNVFLVDPTKRRAIEHVAEAMFGDKIKLIPDATQRARFDKHLNAMTKKFLEAAHGPQAVKDFEDARRAEAGDESGAVEPGEEQKRVEGPGTAHGKGKTARPASGIPEPAGPGKETDGEIAEPDRYGLDGI